MRLFGGRGAQEAPQSQEGQEEQEGRGGRRGLRGRRDDKAGNKHTYKMREELVSIGDDYWIENEGGEKEFVVDGKALRVRETLLFKDARGDDLYKIQEKMLKVRDTMTIEKANGGTAAVVKKALVNVMRESWKVEVPGGPDMEIQGNILDHEYDISSEGRKIAEVSKKWFRVRDSYGVEIEPDQDSALILAITACVDQMAQA